MLGQHRPEGYLGRSWKPAIAKVTIFAIPEWNVVGTGHTEMYHTNSPLNRKTI
jgi:hypothetical protein